MGLEPLLCLSVLLWGFALQATLALKIALQRRWDAGGWMRELAGRYAAERGLLSVGAASWTGEVDGLRVSVRCSRVPARMARWLRAATGVRQRAWRHVPIGAVSTLVCVEPVDPAARAFVARAAGTAGGRPAPMGHPVLDQLIAVEGDDQAAVREALDRVAVAEPLVELFGRHPLSVVTGRGVYLWLVGPVGELEPVVALAAELAGALRPAALD